MAYRHEINGHELYYMVNRGYDLEIGRFTQMDPISLLQDYAHAGNCPVRLRDPHGLCTLGGRGQDLRVILGMAFQFEVGFKVDCNLSEGTFSSPVDGGGRAAAGFATRRTG